MEAGWFKLGLHHVAQGRVRLVAAGEREEKVERARRSIDRGVCMHRVLLQIFFQSYGYGLGALRHRSVDFAYKLSQHFGPIVSH